MLQRVPRLSPIQQQDLHPKEAPAPVSPTLSSFADMSKLIEEMTHLRDMFVSHAERASGLLDEISQMQKGEQGEKGDKGDSIFTEAELIPYIEYAIECIKKEIPEVKDGLPGMPGKDGETPVLGVHYFTDAHKTEIVSRVMQNIRQPKDGETPILDHDQLASTVIAKILDGKLLKKTHIDGLDQEIASYRAQFANGKGYVHGGGDTVVAGTGVTIAPTANGTKVISVTGSSITVVTPPEIPDSIGLTFTFVTQPKWIDADGTTYYPGSGFSYAGTTATLNVPPSQYIRGIL